MNKNNQNHKPVYIISDEPEKSSELFGFDVYAKTIAELIANKENKTPLVIGVYGPWGSGKTTLMQTVISNLKTIKEKKDKNLFRTCKSVWFQAWKYKDDDAILAALIEEIFRTMKRDGFFASCKAQVEAFVKKFDKSKAFGAITSLLSGVDISEFFSELKYKEKLGFFDTFQEFFDEMLWCYLNWRPKTTANEGHDDKKAVLVIFIDDLDRCPQQRILNVLETIKLFMDKQGCIFVLGAANEIIEKALESGYGEDASRFMDKIVQVTFNLPQISQKDFESYVQRISPNINNAINPHLKLIISSMEKNPRRLKRFLNNLSLQEGLIRNKGVKINFTHLLYWNIIDYVYHGLRKDLKENPETLFTIKENINQVDTELKDKETWEIPKELIEKVPLTLREHIKDKELVKVIKGFDITTEQLNQLVSFSEISESAEETKEKDERQDVVGLDDMVKVPKGPFLYGGNKDKEEIKDPFEIDVYPVTNSQYQKFIVAGGYTKDNYWSDGGREWRKKNNILQPEYWDNEEYNKPDHPVVGVSFYEAEAYVKWAGKRLPTEQEWEKSARGEDGREYPWGEEFDKQKCNTKESGHGVTTRVTLFPNGVSPYGCYDMAGNVWEWTDSLYDEKKSRVLRGGSWVCGSVNCRCPARGRDDPALRLNVVGFRCARPLTL